jgi:AraC-like DNA-binding protein
VRYPKLRDLIAYPGASFAGQDGHVKAREDANRRLLRARDVMDRAYADPLNVDVLARVALLAPTHFIREFKRVFAETPYRYLQRRRVERAMFMLRHTSRTVTDICESIGFTSLGTFSRTFTAIVGVTPTAYREAATSMQAPTSFAMRWTRPASYEKP